MLQLACSLHSHVDINWSNRGEPGGIGVDKTENVQSLGLFYA